MGVEIPRGNSGTAFVIDFRQPIGFDSWMVRNDNSAYSALLNITKGANLKLINKGTYGIAPHVIDMNPDDTLSFEDNNSALEVGKTFSDPEYGITINTVAVDASGVTVDVTVASTCTHSAPTVSSNSPSGEALIGNSKVYQLSITNNDSAGCKPQTFRVGENSRPYNPVFEVVPVPDKFTLNPGQTKTVDISVKFQQVPVDNFPVSILKNGYNFDLGVDVYPNVLSLPILPVQLAHKITRTTDTTAPSAPTNLRVNRVGSAAAELVWEKPTQNNTDILGYQIDRKFSTGASVVYQFSESNQATALNLLPSTSYTLSVQAFDKNGNYSPVSNSITVTTPAKTDTTIPGQPTNLTASALGPNNVSLSWTAATDNTFIAYYFVNKLDYISRVNFPSYKVYPTFNSSKDPRGIFSENLYNYYMYAYDSHGNSDQFSTNLKVTTPAQTVTQPVPVITIVNPKANTSLEGTKAGISATSNSSLTKMEFFVDGNKIGEDTSSPYSFNWNATTVSNANHTIMVKGTDQAGQVGTHQVTVRVANLACSKVDVDSSGTINISDVQAILGYFGEQEGKLRYNPKYDINSDRNVDLQDALKALSYVGWVC